MTADQKYYDVPEGYALVSLEYLELKGIANEISSLARIPMPASATFAERIRAMNEMYQLPINLVPMMPDTTPEMQRARLQKFQNTLDGEFYESDDIRDSLGLVESIDTLVALADWLGDIVVYCRSEALKYGIPLEEVLEIIMDSNESKLDENGQPIYDQNGKFLKGPNYWKPEPKIKELLLRKIEEAAQPCGNCNGSGRMVRDPDIGTDQECFVCNGSGKVTP